MDALAVRQSKGPVRWNRRPFRNSPGPRVGIDLRRSLLGKNPAGSSPNAVRHELSDGGPPGARDLINAGSRLGACSLLVLWIASRSAFSSAQPVARGSGLRWPMDSCQSAIESSSIYRAARPGPDL